MCTLGMPIAIAGLRILIGCCGSGKTTVTSYTLGTSFGYNCRTGKLEEKNPIDGFVMSAQRADVTRGLAFDEASWHSVSFMSTISCGRWFVLESHIQRVTCRRLAFRYQTVEGR